MFVSFPKSKGQGAIAFIGEKARLASCWTRIRHPAKTLHQVLQGRMMENRKCNKLER